MHFAMFFLRLRDLLLNTNTMKNTFVPYISPQQKKCTDRRVLRAQNVDDDQFIVTMRRVKHSENR